MTRSGWKSSKFHASLIGSTLLTLVFIFASSRSDLSFERYCSTLEVLIATYAVSRVGETFVQRRRATEPQPEGA